MPCVCGRPNVRSGKPGCSLWDVMVLQPKLQTRQVVIVVPPRTIALPAIIPQTIIIIDIDRNYSWAGKSHIGSFFGNGIWFWQRDFGVLAGSEMRDGNLAHFVTAFQVLGYPDGALFHLLCVSLIHDRYTDGSNLSSSQCLISVKWNCVPRRGWVTKAKIAVHGCFAGIVTSDVAFCLL